MSDSAVTQVGGDRLADPRRFGVAQVGTAPACAAQTVPPCHVVARQRFRVPRTLLPGLMLCGDVVAPVFGAGLVGLLVGDAAPEAAGRTAAAVMTAGLAQLALAAAFATGVSRGAAGPVACWGAAVLAMLGIALLWDGAIALEAPVLLALLLAGGAAILGWRAAALRLVAAAEWRGLLARRVVLVGAPAATRILRARLNDEGPGAWQVLAEIPPEALRAAADPSGVPDAILALSRATAPPDAILVTAAAEDAEAVAAALASARAVPAEVMFVPAAPSPLPGARAARLLGGTLAGEVAAHPLAGWRGVAKRAEDLVLASLLLVLCGPLMLLAALLVRATSPGPAIIRQARFGLGNHVIEVLKFRTMYTHLGDASGARATTRGDARVTPLGRWLRRTSIDELPQLINVLRGEMSLVGPRAHPVQMQVLGLPYHAVAAGYAARHRMRPGITGLAQISGYRGLVDTREKAEARLRLDLEYVERWSVWLDLRILWRTVFGGLWCDGAF